MLSIRVGSAWNSGRPTGGTWLHGLVPVGDLSFQTALRRPGGNSGGGGILTVEWGMAITPGSPLPSAVRMDSLVELYAGPQPLGMAVISDTPSGTSVTADGLCRLGEWFYAVDAAGAPTTNITTAVTQAIGRGLRWRIPDSGLPGAFSALSETQAQGNTISALLNAYCEANNKVWSIDRYGYLQVSVLPTSATWTLSPTVPNPQVADDDFTSRVWVRRVNTVDADGQPNSWAVASAADPTSPMVREQFEDLEQLGVMTSTAANAAAQAYLDANKSRAAFSEGVQVSRGQIATPGGTSPELWQVAAGDVVAQSNWIKASGDLALGRSRTWVVGGTQWRQGEPLTVTPIGLAPRTQAQVIQDQSGKSRLEFK